MLLERQACLRTYATHALKEAELHVPALDALYLIACNLNVVSAYLRTYEAQVLKKAGGLHLQIFAPRILCLFFLWRNVDFACREADVSSPRPLFFLCAVQVRMQVQSVQCLC